MKDAPTFLSSEIPIIERHLCLGLSGNCRFLRARINLFNVLSEEGVSKGNQLQVH